jgi:choline dehydrogenase
MTIGKTYSSTQIEDDFVRSLQDGSNSAYEKLHRLYSRRLFKQIMAITRNEEDAEDALQDTFLQAFRAIHSFEGRSQITTWLTRIAINAALMRVRKRRSRAELPFEWPSELDEEPSIYEARDPSPNPEQACEQRQRRNQLTDAIENLEPTLRSAISLWVFWDGSVKDVANALDVSVSAIKTRVHRARQKLRGSRVELKPLTNRTTRERDMKASEKTYSPIHEGAATAESTREFDLATRLREHRERFETSPNERFDFIVCGSGSSGSVVARRLAEDKNIRVLLLEAGPSDDVAGVLDPEQWPSNLGSDRDWGFVAQPNPHLNGRSYPMSMGKTLGGGSSINVMVWAQGHKNDWNFFASEAADTAWNYDSVVKIYNKIESWQGMPDNRRGTSGPVYVQPCPNLSDVAQATLSSASVAGFKVFDSQNGEMMEHVEGVARTDTIICSGKRQSIFRSYVLPWMNQTTLTVLTDALVLRVVLSDSKAIGVDFIQGGKVRRVLADAEIILCMGALNTPRVLMHSGIGDGHELNNAGITLRHYLPAVGKNFQDHIAFPCVWEFAKAPDPVIMHSECTLYAQSSSSLPGPDILHCSLGFPAASQEYSSLLPQYGWTMFAGLAQPKSRGSLHLVSSDPTEPLLVNANVLSDPEDLKAARVSVQIGREVGNAAPLSPFVRREVFPGDSALTDLDNFIRLAATTFWHPSGTAKMGRGELSVVDGDLKVHGIEGLRIADSSIMPRITTGNTMAPCVVIGERVAEILKRDHRLASTGST